jgi:hypothetical protein
MTIGTKVYNGTAWGNFAKISASADTMFCSCPCLATNTAKTELYVAYLKRPFNGRKNNELFVERFNGASWTPMGGALNINGQNNDAWAFRPSLAVSSTGIVYAAWTEHVWGSCPQVYVAHWDGSQWARDFATGTSLNNDGINGSAQSVSLTFVNDKPTVAWSEHVYGNGRFRQIFIKQSDRAAGVETSRRTPAGIRLTGQICKIFDIRGREITRGNPALLNLPNGLYILKARINGKTITDKMLVQK